MAKKSNRAYILINVAANSAQSVCDVLLTRNYVQFANTVFGPYDVIAVIAISDRNKLSDIIFKEIQTIEGVLHTITCIGTEFDN